MTSRSLLADRCVTCLNLAVRIVSVSFSVRLDWLVEFPFQDSQLMAQEEDFQVFFLFGQTTDTYERY
ncbi:MAG: hypothetical protein GY832_40870 [Chloroflexi bacterium]|nr:hypothetical protein [Chloroflexota bacterium]